MASARAFFDAYNAHDLERMLSLCADTAQLRYVPMGPLGSGPIRSIGRRIWSGMIAALPDLTVTVERAFGDSQRIAAEVLIADRNRGYALMHAFLLTVDVRYRILDVTAYWDNVSFGFQATKAGVARVLEAITRARRR